MVSDMFVVSKFPSGIGYPLVVKPLLVPLLYAMESLCNSNLLLVFVQREREREVSLCCLAFGSFLPLGARLAFFPWLALARCSSTGFVQQVFFGG